MVTVFIKQFNNKWLRWVPYDNGPLRRPVRFFIDNVIPPA
jgi:hypothetical protein